MVIRTIATGLIATTAMTATLYLIHWGRLANADMIRAVGSLITRRKAGAVPVGIVTHFATGIGFSFLYIGFWSAIDMGDFSAYVLLGAVTGFWHGLAVSILLVIMVAEYHPLPEFRDAGLGVAVAHLVGHMVYGVTVGLAASGLRIRLDFFPGLP